MQDKPESGRQLPQASIPSCRDPQRLRLGSYETTMTTVGSKLLWGDGVHGGVGAAFGARRGRKSEVAKNEKEKPNPTTCGPYVQFSLQCQFGHLVLG